MYPSVPLSTGRDRLLVLGLALLITGLNALKPPHMDDAAYHAYAAQIARAPLDPYGFQLFWYHEPVPAHEVLAPPVFLYWWALAIHLFGEQPLLWKLWLLPFCWLFVHALHALLRRFAPGVDRPLLCLTVLSPVVLPGLNLMLDVPALALSLFALVRFGVAVERGSFAGAVAAGLVAGLAFETKYTALVTPVVLLLYAGLHRRLALGLTAAAAAGLLVVGWESFTAWRYGTSHFLFHAGRAGESLLDKGHLLRPLVAILGGAAPTLGLLGLAALRMPRWGVALAGGGVLLAFAVPACVPEVPLGGSGLTWSQACFRLLGIGVLKVVGVAASLLLHRWRRAGWRTGTQWSWFLLLWLGVEVAGYFVLTPFPAVRRVLGVVVVATLLVGRLAAHTCREPARLRTLHGIAALGSFLGVLYYAVDCCEAFAQKNAVEASASWLREQHSGTIWYVGHWGVQFHAERHGMRPVVPGRSRLQEGDWLLVPDAIIDQQRLDLDDTVLEPVRQTSVAAWLPLRTVVCYYGGRMPLEHCPGPRLTVSLYRLRSAWAPARPTRAAPPATAPAPGTAHTTDGLPTSR